MLEPTESVDIPVESAVVGDGQPLAVVVLIPTYNEAESVAAVISRLREVLPAAHLLVIDDASPDGTGAVVDALAAADTQVQALHRPRRDGLGAAYRAGMAWALERKATTVIQVDADGSHPIERLPAMVAALADPDVGLVIGSRYVEGGAVVGWGRHRYWLSRVANAVARRCLQLSVRDATAGFRVWRGAALAAVQPEQSAARGYGFQVDLTRRAAATTTIVEVPIHFVERANGSSKMSVGIALEAAWLITRWGLRARSDRAQPLRARRTPPGR